MFYRGSAGRGTGVIETVLLILNGLEGGSEGARVRDIVTVLPSHLSACDAVPRLALCMRVCGCVRACMLAWEGKALFKHSGPFFHQMAVDEVASRAEWYIYIYVWPFSSGHFGMPYQVGPHGRKEEQTVNYLYYWILFSQSCLDELHSRIDLDF